MFYCIIIIIIVVVVAVIIIIIIVIIEKSFTDFFRVMFKQSKQTSKHKQVGKNFLKYKKACLHS